MGESLNQPSSVQDDGPMGCKLLLYGDKVGHVWLIAGTVTCASSLLKAVYSPKAFVPHAASLHQAFAHCARFPTAASRRSLGRVSVPIWPVGLSTRLPIIALVGRYPANKLTGRGPIPRRQGFPGTPMRGSRSIRY